MELKDILVNDRFRSLREVVLYNRGVESQDVDYDRAEGLRRQGIDGKMESGGFAFITFILKPTSGYLKKISKVHMMRMIEES